MAKIKAGGKVFQTKKKLQNYCRYVLNNQNHYKTLEGEWFLVMDDVLRMHECYKEKVGEGSYKIQVRPCMINPRNNQFFILREDGSDTDFSMYKCLKPESNSTKIKRSLREVVKSQVVMYKNKHFLNNSDNSGYVKCPVTKLKISKKSSHLDHYPLQFDEIVNLWLEDNNLTLSDIKLEVTTDNHTAAELKDCALTKSFFKFHKKVAKYRVVLDKVNLQRGRAKVDF